MVVFQLGQQQSLCMYGNDEVTSLAEHFNMDADELVLEWDRFKETVSKLDSDMTQGPRQLMTVLYSTKATAGDCSPNLAKLLAVAAVLPLSTDEVEIVF